MSTGQEFLEAAKKLEAERSQWERRSRWLNTMVSSIAVLVAATTIVYSGIALQRPTSRIEEIHELNDRLLRTETNLRQLEQQLYILQNQTEATRDTLKTVLFSLEHSNKLNPRDSKKNEGEKP